MTVKSKPKKRPADKPEEKRQRTTKREPSRVESQHEIEGLSTELQKLNFVTGNLGIGLLVISKDYRTLWANEVVRQKYGDVKGKTCYLTYRQLPDICPECGVKKVFETGISQHLHERQLKDTEGNIIWLQIISAPMKDKDGNIIAALETILPITERKKTEDMLRQSEQRLKQAQALGKIGDWEFDPVSGQISWSDETYKIYERDRALGPPSAEEEASYYTPEEANRLREFSRIALEEGKDLNYDLTANLPSGKTVFLNSSMHPVKDQTGRVTKLFGTVQDITERKMAEQALADEVTRRRILVEQSSDGIVILDKNGKVYEANKRFAEVLGHSAEEVRKLHMWDWDTQWTRKQLLKMVRTADGPGYQFETRHRRKDGTVFDVEISTNGAVIAGQKLFFCVCRDITERKRTEEQLERWAHVFEHAEWGVAVSTADSEIMEMMNPAHARMHGYTVPELIGRPITDVYAPEFHDALMEHIRLAHEIGHHTFESMHIRKDGTVFPVLVDMTAVKDEAGQVLYRVVNVQDITDFNKAEKALRFSAMQWRATLDAMNTPVCLLDLEGKIQRCNIATTKLLDKPFAEIIGQPYWSVMYGVDAPVEECPVARMWQSRQREASTLQLFGRWFDVVAEPTFGEAGNVTGAVYVSIDTTESKRIEEALRENEERYHSLVETSPDMIFVIAEGNIAFINSTGVKILGGTSPEQFLGKPILDFISPAYREAAAERNRKGIETDWTAPFHELKYIRLDGTEVDVEAKAVPVVYHGKPARQVIAHDITERRKAEASLRESEERYRTLFESATEGVTIVEHAARSFTYVNAAFCEITGYTERELTQMSVSDIHPKEAMEYVISNFDALARGEEVSSSDIPCLRKDGTIVCVDIHATPALINGVECNVAFFTDITQRKLAEDEQKKSTQKLLDAMKATIQAMSMTVEIRDPYTSGHQQRVADLATAIAMEMGLPEEQIEGIRLAGVVHDIGKIYVPAEILSKPGRLGEIEFRMIKMHPQAGYNILKNIDFPWPIAQMVLQHHERMHGSGYPAGLSGEDILLGARTLAVADIVEAMASNRPYRPALGIDKALEEISQNKGILYDAEVADACLRLFNQKGFKLE